MLLYIVFLVYTIHSQSKSIVMLATILANGTVVIVKSIMDVMITAEDVRNA